MFALVPMSFKRLFSLLAVVVLFCPFIVKAETKHLINGKVEAGQKANLCTEALAGVEDNLNQDHQFYWQAIVRPRTLKNLSEAVICGIKGGWFSSNRGLVLVGEQIFGSPTGGKAARLIHQNRERGFNFIVDDKRLQHLGVSGLTDDMTVVLPSSFIENPDMRILEHEITHAQNNVLKDAALLIDFKVYDPSLSAQIGYRTYQEGFRADEVEARLTELHYEKARMLQTFLREAWIFADRQRHYLEIFLHRIPSFLISEAIYENGQKAIVLNLRKNPADRDLMPQFPDWVRLIPQINISFPMPEDWPVNYEDKHQMVISILQRRLKQLDALKPQLDPVESAAKMKPRKIVN